LPAKEASHLVADGELRPRRKSALRPYLDHRHPQVEGLSSAITANREQITTLGNDWPLRSPGNARPEQFFIAR
jgi:hypothetical protein